MRELYNRIEECLNKVDFEKLWPSFKRCEFVLYNQTRAYFKDKVVGKPREFYGNTAAKYKGNTIAIWYIEDEKKEQNIPLIASKMVYEMFHAFQMDNNEKRFANEIDGISYPYNEANIQIRYEEIKKLINLFDKYKRYDFNDFISLRLERKELIGKYFDYEMKVEIIEGLANYIEMKSLKMMDEKEYFIGIEKIKDALQDIEFTLDIRRSLYYTGVLLYTILDRENIPYSKEIDNVSKTIFEMIKGRCKPAVMRFNNEEVKIKLIKFLTGRGEEVLTVLKELEPYKCDNIKLIGLDPMNTSYYNGYIYAKRFLAIEEKGIEKFKFGKFVFKIDDQRNIIELYQKEDKI